MCAVPRLVRHQGLNSLLPWDLSDVGAQNVIYGGQRFDPKHCEPVRRIDIALLALIGPDMHEPCNVKQKLIIQDRLRSARLRAFHSTPFVGRPP